VPECLAPGQAALQDTHDQPAKDVDQHDQDARNGIPLDELAGTVHRPIEGRFALQVLASALGFILIDQTHVQIGVDAHLLTRHAVEREPGGHLGHALGTVGDHHVLHDHKDQEHDHADDVIATHDIVTDGIDHMSGIPFRQDQTGRRHVERQSEQRRDQQHRREGREVDWPRRIEGKQQHQQRQREIRQNQQVQQPAGDRGEQHHQHTHHQGDEDEIRVAAEHLGDGVHAEA